jgi:cysteine desulfurase
MVYLDYNAAAPLHPLVADEIVANWLHWANPGSVQHRSGKAAAEVLDRSRARVAKVLERSAAEIVFTASATEAASLCIIGMCLSMPPSKRDIAVLRTEHKAVLEAAQLATTLAGSELIYVDVDQNGSVIESSLDEALRASACMLLCMLVNNETGVIQDLDRISKKCEIFDIHLVSDITQAIGKIPLPESLSDAVYFFSGHKIGTPKGVGCLVIPRYLQNHFVSVIPGGGQERGIRGGTENPALASGLAKALEIAVYNQPLFSERSGESVENFLRALSRLGIEFEVVAGDAKRSSNTANLHFPGVDGEAVLANLDIVEASTGSACNSANPEPSHVLLAMGFSFRDASSCVRFSFGATHNLEEIERASKDVCQAVNRIRSIESRE